MGPLLQREPSVPFDMKGCIPSKPFVKHLCNVGPNIAQMLYKYSAFTVYTTSHSDRCSLTYPRGQCALIYNYNTIISSPCQKSMVGGLFFNVLKDLKHNRQSNKYQAYNQFSMFIDLCVGLFVV